MARPTQLGDSLALDLGRWLGTTYDIRTTCAALVRNARTLHNLAVQDAEGNPFDRHPNLGTSQDAEQWTDRLTAEQERHEAAVRSLVLDLPDHDEGPWTVTFQHDPRGRIVILHGPHHSEITVERGRML